MCGIFAYSGSKNTEQILIEGLKKLEYRGYDSAGIAFSKEGKINHYRVCGGVEELEKEIPLSSQTNSSQTKELGIGHTRWATHGKPSKINAHPHKVGSIYVAHNGVIENTDEIKSRIAIKNILSETDTELIAHLIDFFRQSENLDFFKASLKSIPLLKGSYAVVALCESNPKEIIAFKSGPPLILGKRNDGDFFISSDLQALDEELEVLFLEDEEILHFKDNQFKLFNFKGESIKRDLKKNLSTKRRETQKGKHPHFMIKEILEQPEVLSSLITTHLDTGKSQIDFKLSKGNLEVLNHNLKKSSQILILACGSSYFTGLFAKYILEELAELSVQVEIASEFIYRKAHLLPNTSVLFISQSGETADILSAFKQIEKKNLSLLSLCNVANSTLDRKSPFSLHMEAGTELAVASTKTFSASLLSLIFLAFHIRKIKVSLKPKEENDFIQELLKLPFLIQSLLHSEEFFLEMSEKLKKFKNFFYLGRGLYYPIALEGALKLKEIAYLHAEAYPSGEMKHGPLAMIDKNTALLALLPHEGLLYQKSLTNIKEALSRGADLIAIGKKLEESQYFLKLPKTHTFLHPLLSLIPLQMIAYYTSRSYGYNADRPRNLAKSVTVE